MTLVVLGTAYFGPHTSIIFESALTVAKEGTVPILVSACLVACSTVGRLPIAYAPTRDSFMVSEKLIAIVQPATCMVFRPPLQRTSSSAITSSRCKACEELIASQGLKIGRLVKYSRSNLKRLQGHSVRSPSNKDFRLLVTTGPDRATLPPTGPVSALVRSQELAFSDGRGYLLADLSSISA